MSQTWGSLPLFLTARNKLAAGALMFAIAAFLYIASNRYPLFTPIELPLWKIDRSVPFIPETVWIYVSEYAYFPAVYLLCHRLENSNKYLYSFLALQVVSVLIFLAWPTTFPRHLFPLDPSATDSWTYQLFTYLRNNDTPNNCCPSLHVSSVYLSAFVFLDDDRRKFPWFFIWGTLIAFSTLPTKQHYLVDVLTGFAMGLIFFWIFHRRVGYRAAASLQA